jgi:tetratricopeptide (TPR) repeat protein
MFKHMNLNGGACVVCGKEADVMLLEKTVSADFAAVCGVPAGWVATYRLCVGHHNACLKGAGTISGLPDTSTLEEAIKNAIATYDFQPEADRRARYLSRLHDLHVSMKAFEKAGKVDLAAKQCESIIGEMEAEEEPAEKILQYWVKQAEFDRQIGNHSRAAKCLEKALGHYRDRSEAKEAANVSLLLAEALNHAGADAFRMRDVLLSAVSYFEKAGATAKLVDAYRLLAAAYAHIDGNKALKFQQMYERLELTAALKGKAA